MKKIVVIGGGSGLSTLLKGLKLFPLDITGIVTTADDGSSSGILRKELNIPAVGDLRKVLVSLSNSEEEIEKLFNYRFSSDNFLNNHPVGNFILAALYNINGSLTGALESINNILKINGRVLPLTEDKPVLVAHYQDGKIVEGESSITAYGKEIKYLEYKDNIKPTKEVLKAIDEADLIVLSSGSLYTSLIPNLLPKEMREHLSLSNAKKIYICNIMTQYGETPKYKASDFIRIINNYLQDNILDAIITSNTIINKKIINKYQKENSELVEIDTNNINDLGVKLISADITSTKEDIIKHDSLKTALEIFNYLMKECQS